MSWRRLLQHISSMNVAVMLLLAIAIASVAGTVLRQNQPNAEYLFQFGPFWHQIYQTLGLYDVYASSWFMLVLGFLIVSTSLCVIRNTPGVLRQFSDYHKPRPLAALERRAHCHTITLPMALEAARERLCQTLRQGGWRVRQSGDYIGCVRGRVNRLSYLLVHLSILLICIGGLIDSSASLRLGMLSGQLAVEKRDLPAQNIPEQSRLGEDHRSFRSAVLIPEGKASNFSFINLSGGYLLQELPFTVQLLDFRIEHYASGQPKSFASDVRIFDTAGQAETHTIEVNRPLHYQGYTLYQSSFEDGGSRLELGLHSLYGSQASNSHAAKAWRQGQYTQPAGASGTADGMSNDDASASTRADETPRNDASGSPLSRDDAVTLGSPGTVRRVSGVVGGKPVSLHADGRHYQLLLQDFRRFNIVTNPDGGFVDQGPRFQYTLRAEDGTSREFQNYMQGIEVDGYYYLLSGVRSSANEDFQFLYLPLDEDFSTARFFRFHAALHDDALLAALAEDLIPRDLAQQYPEVDLGEAIVRFAGDFRSGRLRLPATPDEPDEADQQKLQLHARLLQDILAALYGRLFSPEAERRSPETAQTAEDEQFSPETTQTAQTAENKQFSPETTQTMQTAKDGQLSPETTQTAQTTEDKQFPAETTQTTQTAKDKQFSAQTAGDEQRFFQDSVLALAALAEYGAPVFVALNDFEHRQASGLQINRAPGATWVYLGFLMLVCGVFAMFYVAHQRLFIRLKAQDTGVRVWIAGEPSRRHKQPFAREFAALCQTIDGWTGPHDRHGEVVKT